MKTALIVVDVQQSFRHRPYWRNEDVPAFIDNLQKLIDRCEARRIPVLQVFHQEEDEGPRGAFSRHSGYVKAMPELRITPDAVFFKGVHSAAKPPRGTPSTRDSKSRMRSMPPSRSPWCPNPAGRTLPRN